MLYMNFHLKDDLRMEFIVYIKRNDAIGALTSFALYDPYSTNAAHEQYLMSEIRSSIDYLI